MKRNLISIKNLVRLSIVMLSIALCGTAAFAQSGPDCTEPGGGSIIVTDLSGTTVYADTKMGPSSVNYTWTGSPVTFWFDHGCDFWSVEWEFYYYSPNSDWGDCDTMGATQWTLTLGTNVGISPWDDWGADITFNAVGTYQITASFPGWSCTGGQCGPTVQGCGASVIVNILLPQPTSTPTPTPSPTPTPTVCQNPTKTRNLTASKHSTVVMSAGTFDGWLQSGFQTLRLDEDGPNNGDGIGMDDVACCFKINRSGAIQLFGGNPSPPALAIVNTVSEYYDVVNYGFNINVVNNFGGPKYSTSTQGLSVIGGDHMVIKQSADTTRTIYHEYGHMKGLADLAGTYYDNNLMQSPSATFRYHTSTSQCNAF